MTLERRIAQLFRMDDKVWARHASGWSVWTRVATLPVLLLAVWSHAWLGGWALPPVAIILLHPPLDVARHRQLELGKLPAAAGSARGLGR